MNRERLSILYLAPFPPSPPRFGAQARMHGLVTALARRHDITLVSLLDEQVDAEESRRAMSGYCREVVLIPNRRGRSGLSKRANQLRSLVSLHSFEHLRHALPELQATLDRLEARSRFDLVNVVFPHLAHFRLRQAPAGAPPPRVVVDSHEVSYQLGRQFARSAPTLARRIYGEWNWRKLRGEELAAYRHADGSYFCSRDDQERVLAEVPEARTAVVPNAADVDFYRRRTEDPPPDGRTMVFFGLLSTVPNIDGIRWFVQAIWPRVVRARPDARLLVLGKDPPLAVRELAGPGVEVAGFVADLRPSLAAAAAVAVPLRLGGGTRLKIVEAMAMGRPVVSTTLGAEGLDVVSGRDLLIADEPETFAAALLRVLDDRELGDRLGTAARQLAVARYAWTAAADTLESFFKEILEDRRGDARATAGRLGAGGSTS